MKVCYVGNFEPPYSTENDVRRAFEFLGWDVFQAQEDKIKPEDLRQQALESDLVLWTSTWDTAQPIDYTIETLRLCGLKGIPTATIHLDIFFGSDRGDRKWWLNPMFFTAYVFTADGSHQKEFERLGVNHYWLRPAVRHDAAHFGKFKVGFECDVAFVGANGVGYHVNTWPYRRELVDFLRDMCKRRGWSWLNPGGDDPKIDRSDDMNDFYASAKVTVGDSLCLQGEDTNYCSDRAYEAPGRGGFLIMPKLNFLVDDYDGFLPMYNWGQFKELEVAIEYYLQSERARKTVVTNTQEIARSKHTYVNRVEEIIKRVGLK